MIVYSETNLVVEIAFEQEQSVDAIGIVELAETARIALKLPSLCFTEAHERIVRREREIVQFQDEFQKLLRDLSRTSSLRYLAATAQPFLADLSSLNVRRWQNYESIRNRLFASAELLDVNLSVFQRLSSGAMPGGMTTYDALIYSVILEHLDSADLSEPKCFVSRDARAFNQDAVRDTLRSLNCLYFDSFRGCLAYLRYQARV